MKIQYKIRDIIKVSFSLAKANFRLRIEGSYLGILWYLLNPLALFIVLYFVKITAFAEIKIAFFPLYLLIGISGFNFFKQAITNAIDSINTNPDYLKSINRIAPESLVIAVVLQAVFSHIFEFLLIIALAIYLQVGLPGLLIYPAIFLLFFILTLGIAFIFATLGAFISDLNNIWAILSQILLLVSPIFYTIEPGSPIYKFNLLNPLFYFLAPAREIIISGNIASPYLLTGLAGLSLIMFGIGIVIFNKYKNRFAELL